nr:integrase, catalytic region, zinc finger, CCHC-type, peptidase aspartic, catalytic [Tanacetum cinerariifolium]
MSTPQDIYVAGFKNRPPMLNKENYVPWSSCLLRRMIPEPGDLNRKVPVNETFHVQIDDELTKKELKQIKADDQAIQTILLSLPEDIYAPVDNDLKAKRLAKTQDPLALMAISNNPYTFLVLNQDQPSSNQIYMQQPIPNPEDVTDPTTAINIALALMAKACKLNYSTSTNNHHRISPNLRNRQIAQPGMNMGQDRQMQMVRGNGENQNRVIQNAVQNPRIQNVRNQNGLIGVPGNANQNPNGNVRPRRRDVAYLQTQLLIAQKEEAGIQLQDEEFDLIAVAADLDEIEEVNANCILMANLQQASTSGTQTDKAPVYDSDGSAEKKKLKSDFKIREDELLDKQIKLEKRIKELDNILVKMGQSIKTIHMLSPKPDSFYHTKQKMALGYQNPFSLKQAQQKQQSLYDGKVLLEKHDPPVMHDSEKTLQLAQEIRLKMKQLNKEIKTANYSKINHLSEVKSTIVTLQRVVKQRMTLETHNWSSSAHKELHKIIKDEIFPIVYQVDARVQNFKIQFLKESAKFVGDFKSLAKEAVESLAKHKALELEIERLLREVVSQDIMSVVQNNSVDETSNLQTKLERIKERFENYIIKRENEYAKLWNDWYKKCEECKFDKISNNKAYNDMQQKIEQLQARLEDLKGKSKDTSCSTDTLNPLSQKLENENVELEFQVSDQKDTTRGMSGNTKFGKQSILGKLPKVSETHALSKPVTSNLIPTLQESKVIKNDKVIALGMFRINPCKPSRKEKHVPNKVRASARINLITVSQPHTITKKVINSDSNGLSSTRNVRSKVVCAMCKQCLNSVNHDVCLLNYVNGMNSRGKKQKANVSINEHQQKQKPKVIQICLWCINSGCSKHMTGNLKLLINFIWKYLGTVRFGNDHVAAILGFSALQWGNILIIRVYFVEGLGHNLFSIGQFCDWDLEVAFRRNACFVRNLEAIATACFTQNRSIIHCRFNKTPYELINERKPDISFLHVFGALCYPKNDHEDIGKLGAKGDIGFFISSGLDLTYAPLNITTQQPTKGELDLLFEAMYDDYIGGQPSTASRIVSAAHAHQVRQAPMTSTSIAETAPTLIISSPQATNFPNTSQCCS